jgi:hypothetical protein
MPLGVFSHHIVATAVLSDYLNDVGIGQEIAGLPDSMRSAFTGAARDALLRHRREAMDAVQRALVGFVTERDRSPRGTLHDRLEAVRRESAECL